MFKNRIRENGSTYLVETLFADIRPDDECQHLPVSCVEQLSLIKGF